MAAEAQAPAADAAAKVEELPAPEDTVTTVVVVEKGVEEPETEPKPEVGEEPKVLDNPPKEEPPEEPVDPEKKALDELKQLLSAAIANREFSKPPPAAGEKKPEETKKPEGGDEPQEPIKLEGGGASGEVAEKKEGGEGGAGKEEEEPKKIVEEAKPEEPIKAEETEKVAEEPEENPQKEEGKVEEELVKPEEPKEEEEPAEPPEEIALWGVPLHEEGERLDTILLKFLRARENKPKEALAMIKDTVAWRRSFGIDGLLEEDLGVPELQKAVFMRGVDREGHPVCYNVYGELEEKEVFLKAFGDEEKRTNFLRWRVQFLEKGIRELLDFAAGGVSCMVQVNDLKGAPWLWRKEIRVATKHALHVLQDNYPEFVANQVFINVPWWYLAFNRMMSPFLTQRTKSKFIFAGPSRSADILFKYIAPEQVPVQFGGLSKENDEDFCNSDAVVDTAVKPSSKHIITIPAPEPCTLVWELRVLGWDVSFGAEFVPDAEDGYTIIVQKSRKLAPTGDPVEKNSYKSGEPGKIVLTVDNPTNKKKKLLYRYKAKNLH